MKAIAGGAILLSRSSQVRIAGLNTKAKYLSPAPNMLMQMISTTLETTAHHAPMNDHALERYVKLISN